LDNIGLLDDRQSSFRKAIGVRKKKHFVSATLNIKVEGTSWEA